MLKCRANNEAALFEQSTRSAFALLFGDFGGCRVWGLGFRVLGLGFRVWGCRVSWFLSVPVRGGVVLTRITRPGIYNFSYFKP